MKFLFIVQGEGRGHLTQAITLEEILRRNGHEVVEVLVGKSSSRRLPGFFNRNIHAPVKRFVSPNFLPTPANKRVSLMRSVAYNLVKLPVYINSINYIRQRIEASGADRVINFYELLTGLTYFLFRPSVPQICIGHQYLFLHKSFEFPKADKVSLALLKFFTVLTSLGAKERLALSFRYMKDDPQNNIRVIPPLLRKEVTLHEPYSCEAMYLGKPILMVPAHIEQDCNAYDAKKSGAGIISSDFNLQQLLEFAKDYHPNRDFVYWVRGAEYTLLNLLESDSSNYQQVLFNEMYLVEEFI